MTLKMALWSLRRVLGLSPTQKLLRDISRRGVRLADLSALEVFGGTGKYHTRDYAARVARLEIWEIDPALRTTLATGFPNAKIKITDSYEEMYRTDRQYDLLVIDNPEGAHGQHYEHYDMFPDVLRLATDSAIVITSIRPGSGFAPQDPRDTFDEGHLARRRVFFGTDHPEQLSFEEMIPAYRNVIRAGGFDVEWHILRQRTLSGRLHYLVLKLRKFGEACSFLTRRQAT